MYPIPPSQVDFHSSLKYLMRLPELQAMIEEHGSVKIFSAILALCLN